MRFLWRWMPSDLFEVSVHGKQSVILPTVWSHFHQFCASLHEAQAIWSWKYTHWLPHDWLSIVTPSHAWCNVWNMLQDDAICTKKLPVWSESMFCEEPHWTSIIIQFTGLAWRTVNTSLVGAFMLMWCGFKWDHQGSGWDVYKDCIGGQPNAKK